MAARLVIQDREYALWQTRDDRWTEVATLAGGAAALLAHARPVDEARLEAAIQVAEDWLMPHAARLHGEVLEVRDEVGRLASGLEEVLSVKNSEWSVADLEHLFLRIVDLATGRNPPAALQARPLFIADVLMLRELAHHGQVHEIRLAQATE